MHKQVFKDPHKISPTYLTMTVRLSQKSTSIGNLLNLGSSKNNFINCLKVNEWSVRLTHNQKVDDFLSDMHQKVFSSKYMYTTELFHLGVDAYTKQHYEEAVQFFTKVIVRGREVISHSKRPPKQEFDIEKQILWALIY